MVTNNALPLSMILSILLISFLIHGVERQMKYQHDALKGYYQLGRLMLIFWLPGCHGNHRRPQNVPKVSPKEAKMFLN